MRFKGLDLNLLVTLDCLLTEKNVSRAADKLCLSQSATSGALTRLREYFQDELLVQMGRNMVITPRAAELLPAVRNVLMQVEGTVIKRPEFDPRTVKRDVKIVASDYIAIVALSGTLRSIKQLAPDLHFQIMSPTADPRGMLERGEVDFLAMPNIYLSPDHPSEHLFSDDYCAIVWSENELITDDSLSLQAFLSMRHVTVTHMLSSLNFEGWFVQRFGNSRAIEVSTSSYANVPFLVVGTQRVALMHRRMAEVFAAMMPLRLLEPPMEIPPIHETLQWHAYNDGDECLMWLRRQLVRGVAAMPMAGSAMRPGAIRPAATESFAV